MEIAPHGRELDANAEEAHQMIAHSSFIPSPADKNKSLYRRWAERDGAGRVQTHDLPFRIALPHIVIRELDGFKTGGRSDSVRIAARQANRWILAYLQGQKRSVSTFLSKDAFEMIMRAAIAAGGAPTDVAAAAEATIAALNPPEAWALHFETARQHKERMKEDPAGQGEAE
ncbi:hypothetical protein CF328_g1002 [Tilletia controversa]|nr:hypothetical protein CF328_g1002 [Tilletia controversa]